MTKKVMVILWLLPACNVSINYIVGYLIIPFVAPDIEGSNIELVVPFLFLHLGLPLLIPFLLLQKKKSTGIKEVLFSISSVIVANLIFIAPELIYVIQVKDFDFFDEDTVYRTVVSITIATSFICSGLAIYMSYLNGKTEE